MIYWAIDCENLKGEDNTFYFENYEIAKKNFEILCGKNKDQDEFRKNDNDSASWFDSCYNEYSTYIDLIQVESPTIHNEIIF